MTQVLIHDFLFSSVGDTSSHATSKKQVAPVESQVITCDTVNRLHEISELHDLGTGTNTFCSPKKEVVNKPVDDGNYEVTDGPVNDDGLYEIAGGPINDATYEVVTADMSLYDVPRCLAPRFDTCDNAAYNAVTFEKPAYANINNIEV